MKGEAEAEENEEDKDKASLINVDSWMRPKHAFLHAFPKGIIFIHRYGKGQMFGLFQTLNVLLVDRSASPTKNEKGGDAYSNIKPCGLMMVDEKNLTNAPKMASLVVGTYHLGCFSSQDTSGKCKSFFWGGI